MRTFLITFDIIYPSIEVQRGIIENAIKSFGYWARPTSSVWLIKTYSSIEQVMQRLRSSAGPADKILIMRVDNEWISLNLDTDVVNWIKSAS